MGLGRAGAVYAAKSCGIISVVLLSAYRVIDYFLTDEVTLSQLIGTLAMDVVKVGIVTGVSIVMASIIGSAFTLAVGPIVAVVFVGVFGSMALSAIDEHYKITESVIAGLDEMGENVEAYYKQMKQNVEKKSDETVTSVIDYAVESAQRMFINTARHHINKFLSRQLKVF